jgi:hypothetical protein
MIHVTTSTQSPNLATKSRHRVATPILSLRKILFRFLAQRLVLLRNLSQQILRQYLN